ncbi:ATP-binding protein [Acidobacteriota bacterium]
MAIHRIIGPEKVSRGARVKKAVPPSGAAAFASIDDLLEAARQMFRAREEVERIKGPLDWEEDEEYQEVIEQTVGEDKTWTDFWHDSFEMTGDNITLCCVARAKELSALEREIVTALILDRLALLEGGVRSAGEMVNLLGVTGTRAVDVMRCLSEQGRLYKMGLIAYDNEDEDLRERNIVVDPVLVDSVFDAKAGKDLGFDVKREEDLHHHICTIARVLRKKSDAFTDLMHGCGGAEFFRFSRKADRLVQEFEHTLELHPKFKLNRLFRSAQVEWDDAEKIILLALFSKELGYFKPDDRLYCGGGLVQAACCSPGLVELQMGVLTSDGDLIAEGYVQPCMAKEALLTDDPKILEQTEFELAPKSLDLVGFDRQKIKRRGGGTWIKDPRTSMSQLVLSREVQKALHMAMSQVRHSSRLIEDWGLGRAIPYGRAVSLMFSGPPGVGKTACAEALARELGKPILVADYSQIQNCLVGNTEKNIVRTFMEARRHDAVLFWDEADAMFFDRDDARHTWEVRDVNVLLAELERFEGVCILATNRRISLDKALERRITLKVEFEPPDRKARHAIWKKLLPPEMPLSKYLNIQRLSEPRLTGGEIKNVVLNAARLALGRNARGPVMMHDFARAIEMERPGVWCTEEKKGIGF